MVDINIWVEEGKGFAGAARFIEDPLLWNKFRRACERSGATYRKSSGFYVFPLENAAAVARSLQEAGLGVTVAPEAKEALAALVDGAQGLVEKALARARALKPPYVPRPYQFEGIEWLAPAPAALLGDQQRLGKTLQTLMAAPEGPGIVVCPAIAKPVWKAQCEALRPDLRPVVLSGRGSFRYPLGNELVIINFDLLPPEFQTAPPGLTVIFDECHGLKSSSTMRTKNARALRKAALLAGGRVWGLTGTPIMNRPMELWNVLETLSLSKKAFGSWSRFLSAAGGYKGKFGTVFDTSNVHHRMLAEGLKKVMLRRERVDVAKDLPPKIIQYHRVDIDRKTLALCDKAMSQLGGVDGIRAAIESIIAGELETSFEELSRARTAIAKATVPCAIELVRSIAENEEPVLVFSAHLEPLHLVKEAMGDRWEVITGETSQAQREKLRVAFQAGELDGLCLSIAASGTAIDLSRAGNEVFIDLDYTPTNNDQAEDRAVAYGQTRGLLVTRILPNHPLPERVIEIITEKMALIAGAVSQAKTVGAPRPILDIGGLNELSGG